MAQTLASVGPYALYRFTREAHRFASSTGTVSPPRTSVVAAKARPHSSHAGKSDGASSTWLMRWRLSVSSSGRPGSSAARGARYSAAPLAHAIAISQTLASKLNEANWRMRLVSSMSKSAIWARLLKPP